MATYLPNVTDVFPDPVLYTPDFSFLDNMLKRRTAMYEQGYSQLAGKYNYLNRELTNPMNVAFRDKFLKAAQEQLKNLSSMDLSLRQNVENAASVFEPFYKNKTALGDMALTDHWNQQESLGNTYRTKDGGKEFSEDNLRYVQMQREQFRQSDPSQWQSFYSNRRSYSPYYNYYNEVQEAMKTFKPSRMKTIQKDGFYMNVVEDQSWTQEELSKYLNGVLSDKAKNQMGIEAAVRLGSNPEALSAAYMQEANRTIPVIDRALDNLNRKIAADKNPNNVEAYKRDLEYYQNKKDELTQNIAAIQEGDLSYIRANSTKLANLLYLNQKTQGFIDAFAHKDISQDITFDQAALTIFKENQENWRTKYKEDRADERELGKQGQSLIVSVDGENVDASSMGSLRADLSGLETNLKSKHLELKDHIATVLGNGRTANSITDAEFEVFIKNNPADRMVANYTKLGLAVKNKKNDLATFKDNANEYARQNMGDAYEQLELYRKEKDRLTREGGQLSPDVQWDNEKKTFVKNMTLGDQTVKVDVGKYYFEGAPTGGSQFLSDKKRMAKSAETQASINLGWGANYGKDLEQRFNTLRDDYLKNPAYKEVTTNRKGLQLLSTDPRFKAATDFLSQNSGIDKGKITSLTYVPTPTGLDIQMGYTETESSPVDVNAAVNLLTTRFANNKITVDTDRKLIKIKGSGSMISPMLDPYSVVEPLYKEDLQELEQADGRPGSKKDKAFIVQDKAGRNLQFRIRKTFGNSPEGDGYYLYGDGTTKPLYDTKFDNVLLPYKTMMYLLQEDPASLNVLFQSKK